MKVLFYSSKGGQGKTIHAISYAKHRSALYLTNDFESGTIEIYRDILPEDQLHIIRNDENLELDDSLDMVFDFGGWVDERIETVAQICDVVVVPIFFQSMADLMPCIKTVNTLSQFNENTIILINNTEKKLIEDIKKGLKENYPDKHIFIIKRSNFITRIANEGKTLERMATESPLSKYTMRELTAQIEEFYNYLSQY